MSIYRSNLTVNWVGLFSLWQEVAVRTRCHLIYSDPELLGRSLLSVTRPDRGQWYAVIRGSRGSGSWTEIFVPEGAWAGGADDGTTEYLHLEICCPPPFLCGVMSAVSNDLCAFFFFYPLFAFTFECFFFIIEKYYNKLLFFIEEATGENMILRVNVLRFYRLVLHFWLINVKLL